MIEIKKDPTPREVRIFGLLWVLFFGAVGALAWWKPEGLIGAAAFLSVAWIVSMIFNPVSRRIQLGGLGIPALFAASGGAGLWLEVPRSRAALTIWIVGLLGAALIWALPRLGRRTYVGWMYSSLPIGWTISHFVLGAVYYLVLTPIGLVMRWVGRDPMKRRFEPSTPSYWVEREVRSDPDSHFRQF